MSTSDAAQRTRVDEKIAAVDQRGEPMLFLYRPRETWMPYPSPRGPMPQSAYNRRLQQQFQSTRRVPPTPPRPTEQDRLTKLRSLGDLHRAGDLTDEEFASAKAKLLGA